MLTRRSFPFLVILATTLMLPSSRGTEIDFVEDFVLARDRTQAIEKLVPGTDLYYFYQCLHLQNQRQYEDVDKLLPQWQQRHGETAGLREMRHRQMLLTYASHPKKTLDYLIQALDPALHHQREQLAENPTLPTSLDPNVISYEVLKVRALGLHRGLEGFHDATLDLLDPNDLDPLRRRELLSRLVRPTHPHLVEMIAADLDHPESRGFGSLGIHRNLTTSQLEDLVTLKPALENQANFVHTYLQKLHPTPDVNLASDPGELESFLGRCWQFVSRLNPSHNSLKAHILYHWLTRDQTQGVSDKQRFLQYLALPRHVGYVSPRLLETEAARRYPVDLGFDLSTVTELPPIHDDESLVRQLLLHFLRDAQDAREFAPFVRDDYLRQVFAEAKITAGIGDPAHWFSLLPPDQYQAITDRVDLEFAPTNPSVVRSDDPISLELLIKNVNKLIIKVYEVNTDNYYRNFGREVNTDIELDGLIANEELTYTYELPPVRRHRERFEFPKLQQSGVYVIDFIGNGKSSRAVVRKGSLQYLVRTGANGHVFHVFDDQRRPITDGRLWMSGRQYKAQDDGTIAVPFSTQPGRQPIVLSHGNLSSLHFFEHQGEAYTFQVAAYVDREALLPRSQATLLLRPDLKLAGRSISPATLERVRVTVQSTNHAGVSAERVFTDVVLLEDGDTPLSFIVPDRLAALQVTVAGEIHDARRETITLVDTHHVRVNLIDQQKSIEDLQLTQLGDELWVQLMGRSGEALRSRAIQVELSHDLFRDPIRVDLATDVRGMVQLGRLPGISQITARVQSAEPQEMLTKVWPLRGDRHAAIPVFHAVRGEAVQIPHMLSGEALDNASLSLLELRGDTFAIDRTHLAQKDANFVTLRNLPVGDFSLQLGADSPFLVRVTEGELHAGYVLGNQRWLEQRRLAPLQITAIETDAEKLHVQLANHSPFTRVHVYATRFYPAFDPFDAFNKVREGVPQMQPVIAARSRYMAGRELGDELRYVLERAYANKFPGNMLEHPSLLLNSWPVRNTETAAQTAQPGEDFGAEEDQPVAADADGMARQLREIPGSVDFSNLDFLAEPSDVVVNLVPNEQGEVTVDLKDLGAHHHFHVVAIDPLSTVYRSLATATAKTPFRDLRLHDGLDPNKHFTQRKQIEILPGGKAFELSDITTSRFETYNSLPRVYDLMATLTGNEMLAKFRFVLDWPKLSSDEKQAKYAEFACHELNFFLYKKDPEFFQQVIRPYLANKQHKTFLDLWLLEADLARFLQPWEYAQLNVAERLLLGLRIDGENDRVRRMIEDQFSLIPRDVRANDRWFETAIAGKAMENEQLAATRESLTELRLMEQAAPRGMMGGYGGGGGGGYGGVNAASEPSNAAFGFDAPPSDDAGLEKSSVRNRAMLRRSRSDLNGRDRKEFFDKRMPALGVVELFEILDKTQEWAENNYYRLAIEDQHGDLVPLNAFWHDYARHAKNQLFFSIHWPAATANFTEMMFALSLLDLPLEQQEVKTEFNERRMTLVSDQPLVVFHEQIQEAEARQDASPVLISQNIFRDADRYRIVNGERRDNFVKDEFLTHTIYGCQVVVTNPTSAQQHVQLLLQIPHQALPVGGRKHTETVDLDLEPFRTETVEYFFYFPAVGEYDHFPVHASQGDDLLGFVEAAKLKVVATPTNIDKAAWDYVSQFASNEEVLAFLRDHNVFEIDLERIAFRMADKPFFDEVIALLTERHAYEHVLWGYGLMHDHHVAIADYLKHSTEFLTECGAVLQSELVVIDPVARKTYQHLDYKPLVNARAHQLGRRQQILNDRFHQQYHALLNTLRYEAELQDGDRIALTYYLLLQGRIDEAVEMFASVNPDRLDTRLQYDYFAAYLDCYHDEPTEARAIVTRYANYPVPSWQRAFAAVRVMLDELDGKKVEVVDPRNRTQNQTAAVAAQSNFSFRVEDNQVRLEYQNLETVQVNYYLIDLELLFSTNPFVQQFSGQFSHIRPNLTAVVTLPKGQSRHLVELPAELKQRNVLVEVVGDGVTRSQPYFSNSLAVQVSENFGQLKVTDAGSGRPLVKSYVKVYAENERGDTKFYKDGYTDLRGRFDYASLSTDDLDHVKRFSILVLDENRGGLVREAQPPKR